MDEAVSMKAGICHEFCFFHGINNVNDCVYWCAQHLETAVLHRHQCHGNRGCAALVHPLVLKWSELVLMENQSICFNSLKIQQPILKKKIQEPEENILWASGKNCF